MEYVQYFNIMLFNMTLLSLFILCVLSKSIRKLDLYEGDICGEGLTQDSDYVCTRANDCKSLEQSIKDRNYLDICSFNGSLPIICCPQTINLSNVKINEKMNEPISNKIADSNTATKPYSADEMCLRYFELTPKKAKSITMYVVGGLKTGVNEFPHMVLLGFGNTEEEENWGCGGSLISDKWILTAAHCQKIGSDTTARWARIRVSNPGTKTGNTRPKKYRIVEHVIHPDYKPPSVYNDIALFRLEMEIKFSQYIKPICLNSDPLLNPEIQIATGWGRTSTGGPTSADLLKVDLNIIPANKCNASYFSKNDPKLKFGIISESMICAGSTDGEKDTCAGDSGGPLQTMNNKYDGMYTQFGITSFGKFCGDKDTPGVYTRVSKYIKWIEQIAFPIKEN